MDSKRFPGKPLVDICGKPMIVHVWENCLRYGPTVVATPDDEIAEEITSRGGFVEFTGVHSSGTDRVAEVAARYKKFGFLEPPVIINVQGDIPLIKPEDIYLTIQAMKEAGTAYYNGPVTVPFCRSRIHIGIYAYRYDILQKFAATPQSPDEKKYSLEQLRMPIDFGFAEIPFRQSVDTPADLEIVKCQLQRA